MINKYLNLGLIIIIILSIIVNFNYFIMGSASSLLNLATTIIYILFWFTFIWLSSKNRNNLIFSLVWSVLTFVCSAAILAVNINNELIIDFIIPFTLIFITPLYGLEALFNEYWALKASMVMILISLLWFNMSFVFLKMKKKVNEY